MDETRWWKYVQRLIGDDTAQEAARRAGFDKSAFTRWKKGARADPEFVLKLARAYHANVLEALVEAEFISAEEASLTQVNPARREVISGADELELIDEIRRRSEERFAASARAVGQRITSVSDANVHALPPSSQDVTLADLEGLPYVAKSADPEDQYDTTDHDNIP